MSTDPRILKLALQEFSITLREWSVIYTSAAENAGQAAREIGDATAQSLNYCLGMEAEGAETVRKAQAILRQATDIKELTRSAVDEAARAEKHVNAVRNRAHQAVATWQQKVQEAQGRLQDAQSRLRSAVSELHQAEAARSAAESEYSNAAYAYNECRNSYTVDSEGRKRGYDCSGFAAQVQTAEARVARALEQLSSAKEAVHAAERAVDEAMAHLNYCNDYFARAELCRADADALQPRVNDEIHRADNAVREADDALALAHTAEGTAERGYTHAKAALAAANEAETAANESQEAAVELVAVASSQGEIAGASVHRLDEIAEELSRFDDGAGLH